MLLPLLTGCDQHELPMPRTGPTEPARTATDQRHHCDAGCTARRGLRDISTMPTTTRGMSWRARSSSVSGTESSCAVRAHSPSRGSRALRPARHLHAADDISLIVADVDNANVTRFNLVVRTGPGRRQSARSAFRRIRPLVVRSSLALVANPRVVVTRR